MLGSVPRVRNFQGRTLLLVVFAVGCLVSLMFLMHGAGDATFSTAAREIMATPGDYQGWCSNSDPFVVLNMHVWRQDRFDAIRETWVPHPKVQVEFFTTNPDLVFQAGDVYHLMPSTLLDLDKTTDVFRGAVKRFPNARWYGKFDDDTFVNVKELVRSLESMDSDKMIVTGNSYNWNMPDTPRDLMSGGAGYVLSQATAHALSPIAKICKVEALAKKEDVSMDYCLRDYVRATRVDNPGFHWSTPEWFVLDGIMTVERLRTPPITYHFIGPDRRRAYVLPQQALPARTVFQSWPSEADFDSSGSATAVRMRTCRKRFVEHGWNYHLVTPQNIWGEESCGGMCSAFRYIERAGPGLRETLSLLERLYLRGGVVLHSSADCGENAGDFDIATLLESAQAPAPAFGTGKAAVLFDSTGTVPFVAIAATRYHHDVFRIYGLMTTVIRVRNAEYSIEPSEPLTQILNSGKFVEEMIVDYQLAFGVLSRDDLGLQLSA